MKRLILFLLLFAAIKVAGQTTGYLRFDTVRIFKQGGTSELYLINSTKDTLGQLTNIGGGLTRFIKPKKLNDSTMVIGLDTISIAGNSQLFVPRISSTDQEIVRFNGTNGDIQGTPGVTADGSGNFTVPSFWSLTNGTGLQYAMLPFSHGYSTPTTSTTNTPFDYVTGAQTQSSGNLEMFRIATNYNQTSTAGATDFLIRRTETAIGSGQHDFLRFDGGAAGTTERFSVDRLGRVKVGQLDNGTASDSVVVWDASTKYLKKVLGSGFITASNGLTKTGNNITLGGLLTGSTFIEGEQNLFAITNTSQAFILSEKPGDPANYAQLFLAHSGDVRLRNNLNGNQRADIILSKQKILLSVDYDFLSYINSIILDTNFTWTNSRFAVFNQQHGDQTITTERLNKAFNVLGSAYIRDTLHITNFPVGNSTDSVMVWRASDSTVRKVAQSSISGGGGSSGSDYGIDSTVIGGTAGSVLFVGTGPVLAQDNANFFWDNSTKRLGIGTAAPDRLLHAEASDAITNAITFAKRISHISSGTVATNFGIGEEIELENASGTNKVVATQTYAYSDAVNATEDVTWTLDLIRAGTVTNALTVLSSGALSVSSSVTSNGNYTAGAANSFRWSGRSAITSSADGIINLFNNAQNNFTLLTFGGTSSSFPALLRSSANLVVRLADNSANTDLEVLDEAYSESTWNGSNEVPTKNATRDKIEGMNIVQGTYTPTLTNGSNVDASTVPGTTLYYQRQGNQVTVWGMVTIDPNAAAATTVLSISLPIASALTSYTQLSGQATGNFVAGAYFGGFIQGDDTNDRAQLDFTSGTVLNQTWSIRFTYEIL